MIRPLLIAIPLAMMADACLAASSGNALTLHYEQGGDSHASGISLTRYNRGLAIGFSANRISSDRALEVQERTTIYPVYAFASVALRLPVSPYLEFGVDVGDYLLYEADNDSDEESGKAQNSNETRKPNRVDTYGAIGIKTSMRRAPIDFALYMKSYVLTFNDAYSSHNSETTGTIITMSGANLIFNF